MHCERKKPECQIIACHSSWHPVMTSIAIIHLIIGQVSLLYIKFYTQSETYSNYSAICQ